MKTTALLILRSFFIFGILFLLSITVLNAQTSIIIKQRVEISSKALQMRKTSSNSSIPYFEIVKMPQAYDQATDIRVNIPSRCTITGSYNDNGGNTCEDISMNGYALPKEAFNTSACTILSIGPLGGCSCGVFIEVDPPTISVGTTSISVSVTATWCCIAPKNVSTSWNFTITAEPVSPSLRMVVSPNYLDANDYGCHTACVGATLYDSSGNLIEICTSPTMTFTIENPLSGMTLTGTASDGTSIEGTSIEVPQMGGVYNSYFVWDGSDIPNEIDTVYIRAEAYDGTSAVQNILLKKVIPDHFTVTPNLNTIYAGESVAIKAIAKDINDNEVALDGGKSITFTDGSGTGSFIIGTDTIPTQAIVTYDQAKSDSIKYYSKLDTANLFEKYVQITVCRTEYPERNGWCYIDVIYACPVVSLSKSNISPGEKVAVNIMAQTVQGNFSYPADQVFIVSMDANARYGKLYCKGDSGTSITGTQPFKFIAADSLNVGSVVIHISAYPISSGGGGGGGAAASIIGGQKDTLQRHTDLMSMKQTTPMSKKLLSNIDQTKKVLVSPQATISNKLTEQNNVFAQKAAKKQALMNAITEAIKAQKAGKSDALSAKQIYAMVQDLPDFICKLYAILTIENIEPELVVNSLQGDDNNQFIAGTDLPKMPKPLIRAQLKNFNNSTNGDVEFNWTLTIKWQAKGINFSTPQDITEKYQGTAMGQNSDIVDLEVGQTLYGETDMRGGDQITLTVTCTTKVDGKEYKTDPSPTVNPFVIKGQNPNISTLLAELRNPSRNNESDINQANGDPYIAVAWHESGLNQFARDARYAIHNPNSSTPDYPLQGSDPSDYGIMQISCPWNYPNGYWYNHNDYDCDDIIWNWVTNVQQGKLIFDYCFDRAKDYHKKNAFKEFNPPPLSINFQSNEESLDQIFLQTYIYYNMGPGSSILYWVWSPGNTKRGETGKWVKNTYSDTDSKKRFKNACDCI